MGATLVAQAVKNWSHVSDRAFRVLIVMALTAKDNSSKDVPAGLYFGGHDGLVYALDFSDGTKDESKLRAVRLAVDELEEVGATVCTQQAHSGGHAVYKLTLNAQPKPRKVKPRKSRTFHKEADAPSPPEADAPSPPEADAPSPPEADAPSPPYKEPLEEPLEELNEEKPIGVRADVFVGKSAPIKVPEIPPPQCPEPTCAKGFVLIKQMPARCPRCNPQSNVIPFPGKEKRMSDFIVTDCSSCHQPIIWAITTSAKRMPVDAEPEKGGNVALDFRPGMDPLARVLNTTQQFGRTNLRKSHFATCPQADKWRKR